ncbi:hypothetical protein C8R43DRAFT_687916 [Mycena crocata]|nr:hypothetical protein C8R43DRAFT_687916 [Mycena crocata]
MNDDRDLPPLPIRPPEISVAESSRRHSRRSKDSTRDLATLLRLEHSEHLEVKRELSQLTERLRLETLRADEAESRVIEVTERLKRVNEARLIAVGEAARANESLGLYKFQLETAQNEIHRAQSVFNIVEKERYQAELAGARTRTAARRLKEQHKIHVAKEEGRRIGIKEGIEAGRLGVFGDEPDALAPSDLGGSQIDDYENFDDEELSSLGDFAGGEFDSPSPPPRSASILPETNVRNTPVPVPIPPPVLPPLPVPAPGATAPSPSLYEPFHDIHPVPFHNEPPHPRHEHIDVPPDGFIPQTGPDSLPQVPPPHEFSRQQEPNPRRNGASVVEEPVIAPSAFARAMSPRQPNDRRSPSVRAQSIRAERRAPSTAGSIHVRTVQLPTPRLNTNIPGIEHQAQHRSSWSSDFPGGGSLGPQRSTSSGPIPINVLPPVY